MAIQGDTIFAGDSITVGYVPRFVKVDGRTFRLAYGGLDSAWILKQMKSADTTGMVDLANPILKDPPKPTQLDLSSYKNFVLLIGTNDMAGSRTPDAVFANILAIWQIAKKHGLKVIACTIPPFDGYAAYKPTWDVKRDAVNRQIVTSDLPDGFVFLDFYLKDAADPNKLAAAYDSGDHLHPRPDKLGPLIQEQVEGILSGHAPPPAPTPASPVPAQHDQPLAQAENRDGGPAVGVASILVGCGILYAVVRRHI